MPVAAGTLRLATWHADLSRAGPGLLLRDLLKGEAQAVVAEIAAADPDVLLLTDIDYDHGAVALEALAARLEAAGAAYPHRFALRSNTGMTTGRDLDGDGRLGGPRDAQGYGQFAGQGGMALLSRIPLQLRRDFSDLLWQALPGHLRLPGDPAPEIQRLSSSGHWAVALGAGGGGLTLLAWHATPPVFDGPGDRNGRRNRDELALWQRYLDGAFGAAPDRPVLIGNANLDPARGEGRHEAMRAVLNDPRLQDPLPDVPTVDWEQTGPMRVSYLLPAAGLTVRAAEVRPPVPGQRHRMVLVTLEDP
ncbi:endonuclease/exonuclease/phosphatase family protein [Salipiger sp. P9]|uniref:endonuclease/exonuclease/phosphatase family protein n=1 Tax=Salipiger pentaromativorans TaxID=2943193 RepID=UPI0021586245|nr:endonuclease/exonuclease/phosphatase family protein [Salipiger pentaromativorans]